MTEPGRPFAVWPTPVADLLAGGLRRVDRWIFRPGDARRLAAVRIGLCTTLAGRLSRPLYLQLAGQPQVLFRPISFMHLFASMPRADVVLPVELVGVAASLVGAIGLFPRMSIPAAWLAALFLNGMWTSVGQPMHNESLLLLAMVPLLFAQSVDAWSLTAWRTKMPQPRSSVQYGWPVHTAMIVVAGAYFFTGLDKLMFSGPAWALSDNLRWVMYAISDQNRQPIEPALFLASHPLLIHLAAATTLAIETGFPLVLWRPKLAWIFVPGVVLLHLGIGVTMHLDYSAWALTAVTVFVPWERAADRWRAVPQGVADPAGAADRASAPYVSGTRRRPAIDSRGERRPEPTGTTHGSPGARRP